MVIGQIYYIQPSDSFPPARKQRPDESDEVYRAFLDGYGDTSPDNNGFLPADSLYGSIAVRYEGPNKDGSLGFSRIE